MAALFPPNRKSTREEKELAAVAAGLSDDFRPATEPPSLLRRSQLSRRLRAFWRFSFLPPAGELSLLVVAAAATAATAVGAVRGSDRRRFSSEERVTSGFGCPPESDRSAWD
jgi:hypothetical protein